LRSPKYITALEKLPALITILESEKDHGTATDVAMIVEANHPPDERLFKSHRRSILSANEAPVNEHPFKSHRRSIPSVNEAPANEHPFKSHRRPIPSANEAPARIVKKVKPEANEIPLPQAKTKKSHQSVNAGHVQHHRWESIAMFQVAVPIVQRRNENAIETGAKRENLIAIVTAIQGGNTTVTEGIEIEIGVATGIVIETRIGKNQGEIETVIVIVIVIAIKTGTETGIANATVSVTEAETGTVRGTEIASEVHDVVMIVEKIVETTEMMADVTIREMNGEMTEGTTGGTINVTTDEMTEGMIIVMRDVTTDAMIEETEAVGATETGVLAVGIENMSRLIAMCLDASRVQRLILNLLLVIDGDPDVRAKVKRTSMVLEHPRPSQLQASYPNVYGS
jgi:hypothetical protein